MADSNCCQAIGHVGETQEYIIINKVQFKFSSSIKPMVGTCRKRSISAPELETSRHERWEQKLAKDIRKQPKIFYHPHVYVN